MKQVKKMLKEQRSQILPSQSLKQKIKLNCGIADNGSDAVTTNGRSAIAVKKRAGVYCAIAVATLAVTATAVFTIAKLAKSNVPLDGLTEFGTISSATDFYSYGAVSLGNMLEGTSQQAYASPYSLRTVLDATATQTPPITDEQKQILDKYALFATGELGGGKIKSTVTACDDDKYEYTLDVSYTDVYGGTAQRVLYFNKIAQKSDDEEKEYAIVGELVIGSISYAVEGNYETESDGTETESEIEFTAYTSSDKSSYIKMQCEHELSSSETESEFVISIYEQGNLVETAKVSSESENDEHTYEVNLEQKDGKKVSLKFNASNTEGEPIIDVEAVFDGEERKFAMSAKPKEHGGGYNYFYRPDDSKDDDKDDDDKPSPKI